MTFVQEWPVAKRKFFAPVSEAWLKNENFLLEMLSRLTSD